MTIEHINSPGFQTKPANAKPPAVTSLQPLEAFSVKPVNSQDLLLHGHLNQTQGAPQAAQTEITEQVVDELNEAILGIRRELKFSIDKESGEAIVQVWDSENGKMIRQLPSDAALAVSKHIHEVLEASQSGPMSYTSAHGAVGIIFQTTA